MGWGSNNKRYTQQQATEEIMKKLLLAALAAGAMSSGIGITQAADQLVLDRNAAIPVATLPSIGAPGPRTVGNPDGSSDTITFGSAGFPAPNAMTLARNGSLYVSDSFQGAIFRIDNVATCSKPCAVTTVAHDPLLATAGFPPFGANGIALDSDETALFIANTGDNRILKMDLATKSISVFTESVHGADGMTFDDSGRLWVAANQGDQIVALNE